MKASKLRDLSKEDLTQEESELREQLFKLRFQAATGQAGERRPHAGRSPGYRSNSDDLERKRNLNRFTIDD